MSDERSHIRQKVVSSFDMSQALASLTTRKLSFEKVTRYEFTLRGCARQEGSIQISSSEQI